MLTASSLYRKMFIARIGRIFSNISITAAIVCLVSLIGGIAVAIGTAFVFLLLFMAVIFTVGIILLYYPNLFSLVDADRTSNIVNFLLENIAPPSAAVAAAAGVLALVFLLLGEPKKDVGRIVFASIVTAFGVIALIAILTARAS